MNIKKIDVQESGSLKLPKVNAADPAVTTKAAANLQAIPEWAIHISDVYKWGAQDRDHGGKLTKRTIQWYASEGLIPAPQRFGKEAYFNRSLIFRYLRIIEVLNRRFGLLLSEIRRILRKATNLEEYKYTGGIHVDVDDKGEPILRNPIVLLCELLEGFLEYQKNEESQCHWVDDYRGPMLSEEQQSRLRTIERNILKCLRGSDNEFSALLVHSVIGLEEDLFPKDANQSIKNVPLEDFIEEKKTAA